MTYPFILVGEMNGKNIKKFIKTKLQVFSNVPKMENMVIIYLAIFTKTSFFIPDFFIVSEKLLKKEPYD